MAYLKAQLAKVEFVLDVARKDPDTFLRDLLDDPFRTLQQSGIDLSQSETLAVIDIVHDTSWSPLSPRLQEQRSLFTEVLRDNPQIAEGHLRKGEPETSGA